MLFLFEDYSVDTDRRELRRGPDLVAVEPQVFDLLQYLISHRERVVSRDDLIAAVWGGRIVSESTISSRVTAVRQAIGDNGDEQRLIRTLPRKGLRFVGEAREGHRSGDAGSRDAGSGKPERDETTSRSSGSHCAERRQLTVMVCDVMGSVALSGHLDPEDLREVMAVCHRWLTEVIEHYRGFVARYTADGILVYFGYPQAHEDDAERAVRAGLALTRAGPEIEIERLHNPLQPRVSIATSLVVVGDQLGVGAGGDYTVVGEAPHLAARLLALADPGAVVISAGTRRVIGHLFEYADIGPVELKGVGQPISACRVWRESTIASRFDALRPAPTQLIGRGEELDLLLHRWERAKAQEGRVVLVTGEPGIGKSRLIRAVTEELGAEPLTPLFYYCSPYHQDSALYPITRQLLRAAGIEQDDSAEARIDKLEALLAQSSPNLPEDVPLFATILSIPGGARYPAPDLTPQRLKERVLGALLHQLKGLAERQPMLLVFEDLHWIDPTSLELLSLMIEQAPGLPLLLLGTFRPEFKPPWPNYRHVSTISLGRLGRSEAQALVEGTAKGKGLAPALVDQIVTRTDGVPLFIEELTKALLESCLLRDTGDRYELAGQAPQFVLPSTLQASLLARLDRLGSAKDVAQIGAVIGREFPYALVAAVSALPEEDLKAALARLSDAELVFQRGIPPDAKYLFKHALVQNAVYASLVRERRQQLHSDIARMIEEQNPDVAATVSEVLAHHFTEAGLAQKAIRYWLKAGQLASARSANAEAVTHLEKGLALVWGLPEAQDRALQELDLQAALGAALLMSRGHGAPEVATAYNRSYELCQQLGDTPRLVLVLFGLWRYATMRPPLSRARELGEQLLRLAESSDEPTHHVMAHYALGYCALCVGELPAARDHLGSSLEHCAPEQHRSALYSSGQDPAVAGRANRAWTLWLMGYPDQAGAASRESLVLARELAHPFSLAYGLWVASYVSMFRGEARLAQEYAEEGIALAGKHGFALWQAYIMGLRGWALAAQGQRAAGRAELCRGLNAERATGTERVQPFFLTMLAEVCAADDQCEEGLKSVADAQLHADRMGERWWQAEIHRVRGVLLLMRSGDVHVEVEHCFRQALDVARGQAAKSLELRAAASLARLWRDQGKADDARSLLAPIYGWFTEGFDTADLKCAKALLDELGLGRPRAGEVCAELRSGRRRQSSGATVRSRNGH